MGGLVLNTFNDKVELEVSGCTYLLDLNVPRILFKTLHLYILQLQGVLRESVR